MIKKKIFFNKRNMRSKQYLDNMRRRPDCLTESWWVVYHINVVYNSFSTNHSSESSFFNKVMNQMVDEWIDLWPAYIKFIFPTVFHILIFPIENDNWISEVDVAVVWPSR